jgi:hypothetical protein
LHDDAGFLDHFAVGVEGDEVGDAEAWWILAGHDAAASGGADAAGRVATGEFHAAFGE